MRRAGHRGRGGRGHTAASARSDVSSAVDFLEDTTLSADIGVYYSGTLRQRREELLNVTHKKRRLQPTELEDSLAEWIPVEADLVELSMMHRTLLGKTPLLFSVSGKPTKAQPTLWVCGDPWPIFFLDELVRHDGLGDHGGPKVGCTLCPQYYTHGDAGPDTVRIFKCRQCGEFLQCKGCCIAGHAKTPLHFIEEWNGEFWVDISLRDLGYVYQLGHGGLPCRFPRSAVAHYDVTDPSTCATFTCLETFRVQNVVGNMNVHDFITAIERQTDATASTGMDWIPHRYKEFMRMSRQWAHLKRAKRAGRANEANGLAGTAERELAVRCWACPHDKRNLPSDWREVDKKFQFLYMLLVALDANFKLKNRMRLNEKPDPPLGPGLGYFAHPNKYRRHLKNYVAEKDISTCIAFAALLQKDTRGTTGLRTSGVGGCVCARHECVLPHGIGDLQKGERFANMDYVLLGALAGFALLCLTISYDISCQWKIRLAERNAKMPEGLKLPLNDIKLQCALPVWHASSHEESCASANSLSFKPGVRKSDGEGVEREQDGYVGGQDRCAQLLQESGLGDALRDRQVKAFKQVCETVESDVMKDWQSQIDAWLKDSSKPNPYIVERKDGPTEAQVRLQLKRDEEKGPSGGKGTAARHQHDGFFSQPAFRLSRHSAVIDLDPQQRFTNDNIGKLATFRKLQAIYMPGAAAAIEVNEAARDADIPAPRAEHIKLYMPSDLPAAARDAACVKNLPTMEAKMREAQCGAVLTVVRGRLHAKRHLIMFRNENVTGQIKSTKARTLIGKWGDRVNLSAEKYRKGRKALTALKGSEYAPHYRELRDSDIRLEGDNAESDAAAKKKLAMISAGRGCSCPAERAWTIEAHHVVALDVKGTSGDEEPDHEKDLHESVRVEWARAKARKTRWVEEAMILEEEMRRTLRYLEWQAVWWEGRQVGRPRASPQVQDGMRAYALRQAALHRRLAAHFKSEWEATSRVDVNAVMEAANLAQFFTEEGLTEVVSS
ncbi:hypothetical protein B0H14DRAFT_3509188 [Mycena olivaceomarginata]|nr:hypothetical protein B0H14DRAFT_3509188 [Mycena olivaceomarginata]